MSKFTKAYMEWQAQNNRKYDSASKYHKALMNNFKDWQPPKKLVEVPQFVADWIEDVKEQDYNARELLDNDNYDMPNSVNDWLFNQDDGHNINTIIRAWLDGYTVKEEKKYVLKHIDMSKFSKCDSLYLSRSIKEDVFGKYDHRRLPDDADMSNVIDCHFTQSEIDELHIGSYEQIEVEP